MNYSQLAMVATLRAIKDAQLHELDRATCYRIDAKQATGDRVAAMLIEADRREQIASGLAIAGGLAEKMCQLHRCSRLVAEAKVGY